MLVSAQGLWGTIGGGNLEWQAIERARRWLREGHVAAATLLEQRLGPDLAQCCGGMVVLWMERLPESAASTLQRLLPRAAGSTPAAILTSFRDGNIHHSAWPGTAPTCSLRRLATGIELVEPAREPALPLWIFGAGHVGQAVLRLLEDLPLFEVCCLDSRETLLPTPRAAHIRVQAAAEPVESIALAAAGSAYLVLTHDHELDYQICAAVLARRDARWLGLIGSASKAARFRSRLRRDGFSDAQVQALCSPVGLTAVPGKLPAAIAVSIVAQLLTFAGAVPPPAVHACDPQCRRCAAPLAASGSPS
jgi:xanthine dehydrogenase accessory factor